MTTVELLKQLPGAPGQRNVGNDASHTLQN